MQKVSHVQIGVESGILSQVKAVKSFQPLQCSRVYYEWGRGEGQGGIPQVYLARNPISSQNSYHKLVSQEFLRTCLGSTTLLL